MSINAPFYCTPLVPTTPEQHHRMEDVPGTNDAIMVFTCADERGREGGTCSHVRSRNRKGSGSATFFQEGGRSSMEMWLFQRLQRTKFQRACAWDASTRFAWSSGALHRLLILRTTDKRNVAVRRWASQRWWVNYAVLEQDPSSAVHASSAPAMGQTAAIKKRAFNFIFLSVSGKKTKGSDKSKNEPTLRSAPRAAAHGAHHHPPHHHHHHHHQCNHNSPPSCECCRQVPTLPSRVR
jgi:hypothetical protein